MCAGVLGVCGGVRVLWVCWVPPTQPWGARSAMTHRVLGRPGSAQPLYERCSHYPSTLLEQCFNYLTIVSERALPLLQEDWEAHRAAQGQPL